MDLVPGDAWVEKRISPLRFAAVEMTIFARWQKSTSNGKDEMPGFLHCAAHDEAVSCFGRNDGFFADLIYKDKTVPGVLR